MVCRHTQALSFVLPAENLVDFIVRVTLQAEVELYGVEHSMLDEAVEVRQENAILVLPKKIVGRWKRRLIVCEVTYSFIPTSKPSCCQKGTCSRLINVMIRQFLLHCAQKETAAATLAPESLFRIR